jgi:GNAT superfamily N-acetyltransferase
MTIEIKKLTSALAEDYATFFETTPHDGKADTRCYCVTWCGDKVYHNGGSHWYASPEERRAHALRRVRDGDIQGYLACDGNRIVGWCNANTKSDCKEGINYLRSENIPLEECKEGEKIKYIFCFTVAPDMQRKGIATQLLQYICKDAAEEGFDYVEAFANSQLTDAARDFLGPINMYKKCGFVKQAELNGKVVLRKALK